MSAMSPSSAAAVPQPSGTWLTEVLRLTRWELFLAWRRVMAKVLLGILLGVFVIVLSFVMIGYISVASQPDPATYMRCPPQAQGCVDPNPAEIEAIRQQQQQEVNGIRDLLTFPTSLNLTGNYVRVMGLIVLAVLAGTLIGSEYGFGTQRLVFARGVSRGQMLTAQVLALAVLSLVTAGLMLLVGMLVGLILGPALGAALSLPSLGAWIEIVKFWVAVSLYLFGYTLVALFAATLGRGTAAGIALALGFMLLEIVAGSILSVVGLILRNDTGEKLQRIPDWFLGNNAGALVGHAGQYPLDLASAPPSELTFVRALFTVLVYAAVFIGGSYLLLRSRDVTE